jgi:hypothetical protein
MVFTLISKKLLSSQSIIFSLVSRKSMKLTGTLGIDFSPNGVRSMWLRNNMNTATQRVENHNPYKNQHKQ